MTARASWLFSRAFIVTVLLGFSFQVSALPLSPKWMKSSEERRVSEPKQPGVLGDEIGPVQGGVAQALPVPASLWLVSLGLAGITVVRRKR